MKKYLTDKLISEEAAPDKVEQYLDKEMKFSKDLNSLKSAPVESVNDFQRPLVKDMTRDHIDRRGEIVPSTSIEEFKSKQLQREAAKKAALEAKLGKPIVENVIDYGSFGKGIKHAAPAMKTAGKKLLGAIPILGGLASAAMTGDASAAIPVLGDADSLGPAAGTMDDRIEKGMLTDEDKQALRMQALQKLR